MKKFFTAVLDIMAMMAAAIPASLAETHNPRKFDRMCAWNREKMQDLSAAHDGTETR